MLGKESLEELLKTLEHYQGRNTIFDILNSKVILIELDLLEKYEKAFEILKEKLGLEIKNVNNLGRILHKLYYGDDVSTLNQEEYELLEELINNE